MKKKEKLYIDKKLKNLQWGFGLVLGLFIIAIGLFIYEIVANMSIFFIILQFISVICFGVSIIANRECYKYYKKVKES